MLDVGKPANWNRKQSCGTDGTPYKTRKPDVVNKSFVITVVYK